MLADQVTEVMSVSLSLSNSVSSSVPRLTPTPMRPIVVIVLLSLGSFGSLVGLSSFQLNLCVYLLTQCYPDEVISTIYMHMELVS